MNTAVSTTKVEQDPRALVKATVDQMVPQMSAALPKHIPAERFQRVVLTAINQNPQIIEAASSTNQGRNSLIQACMKAAQDGLVLDGREAALVIRKSKVKVKQADGSVTEKWIDLLTYMPMVQGLLKKARNSGDISTISAHVVYANDFFEFEMGDNERLVHKPIMEGDRGAMKFAYMVAHLKDGGIVREVMTRADVEKVRAVSTAKDNGPWKSWEEEMWRKTVLRRGIKYLPSSTDRETGQNIVDIFSRDDELYDHENPPQHAEAAVADEPSKPARKTRGRGAAVLNEAPAPADAARQATPNEAKTIEQQPAKAKDPVEDLPPHLRNQRGVVHDAETGEVIENEDMV